MLYGGGCQCGRFDECQPIQFLNMCRNKGIMIVMLSGGRGYVNVVSNAMEILFLFRSPDGAIYLRAHP